MLLGAVAKREMTLSDLLNVEKIIFASTGGSGKMHVAPTTVNAAIDSIEVLLKTPSLPPEI